jgi:hypothetical protein
MNEWNRLFYGAEPKPFRGSSSEGNSFDDRERPVNPQPLMGSTPDFSNNNNDCVLHVICSPMVSRVRPGEVEVLIAVAFVRQITHDQLWKLCDIVPNLDFCKMNNDLGSNLIFMSVSHYRLMRGL